MSRKFIWKLFLQIHNVQETSHIPPGEKEQLKFIDSRVPAGRGYGTVPRRVVVKTSGFHGFIWGRTVSGFEDIILALLGVVSLPRICVVMAMYGCSDLFTPPNR